MLKVTTVPGVLVLIMLGLTTAAASAQSAVVNGTTHTRAVTRQIADELKALDSSVSTHWIGYSVPAAYSLTELCEGRSTRTAIRLEPALSFAVLAKVESGHIAQLRTATSGCEIDAEGADLLWLTGVTPDSSATWLSSLAEGPLSSGHHDAARSAVVALAWQAGDGALTTLTNLARRDPRPSMRRQALFWLAQRAGQRVTTTLMDAVNNDPEANVKRQAVFALSRLPADDAIPRLIQLADTHTNRDVRKQAVFWLGQSGDPRATDYLERMLRR